MDRYSVQTLNKFDVFGDDDELDPYELLRQEEVSKQKKKQEKVKNTKNVVANVKSSQPAPKQQVIPKPPPKQKEIAVNYEQVAPVAPKNKSEPKPKVAKPRDEQTTKSAEDKPRNTGFGSSKPENKPPRMIRQNQGGGGGFGSGPRADRDAPPKFGDREPREATNTFSPRGRGGFGGRGGMSRGGFGGGRGGGFGRRQRADSGEKGERMDRHSGNTKTGVKSTDKRDGGGAHNWGKPEDDVKGEDDVVEQNNVETPPANEAEKKEPKKEPKSGDEEPPLDDTTDEEKAEAAQKTYDEWKAEQEVERAKKASFNIRKPNEGQEDNLKGVLLHRHEDMDDENEYYDDDDMIQTHTKPKENIKLIFNDRGNKGSRGGGRGARMRGGPGMGRARGGGGRGRAFDDRQNKAKEQVVPGLDDDNFPSLGGR